MSAKQKIMEKMFKGNNWRKFCFSLGNPSGQGSIKVCEKYRQLIQLRSFFKVRALKFVHRFKTENNFS